MVFTIGNTLDDDMCSVFVGRSPSADIAAVRTRELGPVEAEKRRQRSSRSEIIDLYLYAEVKNKRSPFSGGKEKKNPITTSKHFYKRES